MLGCTLEGKQLRHCTAKPIVQLAIIANPSGFLHLVCFNPGTNAKHPCSVYLKNIGVNSIKYIKCIQWVHARCSRVKGSLKNVESSFICRRCKESCKGELCETRQVNSQVNGLHIDGHEYEIFDKFC